MLAICVFKKWEESIGLAADLIVIGDMGDYALIMADPKSFEIAGQFIEVDVLRDPKTEAEKNTPFIPVKINTAYITAIFDLTEAESKKIGFHGRFTQATSEV